jgi:hypothetical protein
MVEQRRYERKPYFCPVHVLALEEGKTVQGRTFDISIGGVGVATDISFKRGQTVTVCFHLPSGASEPIYEDVIGRVAYCQADEGGNRIGVEFFAPIRASIQPALTDRINNL